MLTLLFTANAFLTIIWILKAMQRNATPLTALAAMAWVLAYVCAPQVLLVAAAVLNPIAWIMTTLGRTSSRITFQSDKLGTYLGSGFAVPEPTPVSLISYPAQCFVGA